MVALTVAMFVWLYHSVLVEASVVFALAGAYGVVLFRVVAGSVRAFMVMRWAFLLIYYTLIIVENELRIPAAGPWFLGFLVGGIAGGYVWFGARAGSAVKRTRERTGEAGGGFSGGWRLALINAVCALVLLGLGIAHLVLQSTTAPVAAALAVAVAGGWALFRFPRSPQLRNGLLFVIPVVFAVLGFVGGATDQLALPFAWAYGALAGILLGGRYWSGTRFGAPRAPFNDQRPRRRKRKRRTRSEPKQLQKQ